jgi:hypothetical protein
VEQPGEPAAERHQRQDRQHDLRQCADRVAQDRAGEIQAYAPADDRVADGEQPFGQLEIDEPAEMQRDAEDQAAEEIGRGQAE